MTRTRLHLFFQTLVIMAGMAGLFGVLGWLVFGSAGVYWSLAFALLIFVSTPRISPWMVLRMYRAGMLTEEAAPGLVDMVGRLARKAGLRAVPRLYYVPSRVLNAFSVGSPSASAIAITDGLIRALTRREMAGVLAHEITHIKNNDLRLHALADIMTRITSAFSFIGQVLVVFYLPLALLSDVRVPLVPIVVLLFAPSVSVMLQLALSRTREFDADLGAASLTGDPLGLASALKKMDRLEKSLWNLVVFPGRRNPQPSFLRTHPHTQERVARLAAMAGGMDGPPAWPDEPHGISPGIPPVRQPPRWNWFRPWY